MGNHFACIGLGADDPGEFAALVGRLVEQAVEEPPAGRARHHVWRDGASGAALAFHVTEGEVACVTPFFRAPDAGARWRVRAGGPAIDAACFYCSGADCDVLPPEGGDLITRATVQWVNFEPWREALGTGPELTLDVVAFAAEADFVDDGAAFERLLAERFPREGYAAPLRFADNAFLPIGMFNDGDGPLDVGRRAQAMFGGQVIAARRMENGATGGAFLWVRVAGLMGPIDVVMADRATVPRAGIQAWVQGWLVGQPADAPPAPTKRGWWSRLTGR